MEIETLLSGATFPPVRQEISHMHNYEPPTVTPIGKVEDLTQLWIIVKNRSGGDRLGHRRRRFHVPGS